MLEKTNRINYLFDFYQSLLTPKQCSYMEMYYREDYSLGEISELLEVSRQAVYDNIRRTEKTLESYEDKLHLLSRFEKRTQIIEKLSETVKDPEAQKYVQQLQDID
ncbi:putative DNA-binding protein [Oceanobacillus timonensis]|uniref:putative DNA-binding protein n=1 Tax=Oceanobacillus timonensis TaxID=1926285 RepID=UPI0009BA1944|nr:putative DNA-binding protein [Oceanobacillus timonensis]